MKKYWKKVRPELITLEVPWKKCICNSKNLKEVCVECKKKIVMLDRCWKTKFDYLNQKYLYYWSIYYILLSNNVWFWLQCWYIADILISVNVCISSKNILSKDFWNISIKPGCKIFFPHFSTTEDCMNRCKNTFLKFWDLSTGGFIYHSQL